MNKTFYEVSEIPSKLFGNDIKLLPSVTELFELELAYLEFNVLNSDELVERSAFFKSVNNILTNHYKLYSQPSSALSENRSIKTKNYFENSQFSTGYATHGLFPYRGKFHPQLVKGLINIIGVKKGETILDPMCGSGTTNIEAALMGIDSYAIDLSPFCQFMTQAKYEALSIESALLKNLTTQCNKLFNFFTVKNIYEQLQKVKNKNKLKVYHLALLAFLDALGYSKRIKKFTHYELFKKVLKR